MSSVNPADGSGGGALPAAAAPTGTSATTTTATASIGFKPKTALQSLAPTQSVGTFADAFGSATSNPVGAIKPERMKFLAAMLTRLPDLDLGEMSRVKGCFSEVLGEGRENIVNGLELRVVFGELGLYPSETELGLILRAFRDRVNLVTLTQYLRLYKKEFWQNQAAAAASKATKNSTPNTSPSSGQSPPPDFAVGRAMTAGNSTAGADGSGEGDDDTLKAFVALGGEEDGGGEISATTLRDAIRGFGLTIDIDSMIRTVDVHHSGMLDYVDFCALWSTASSSNADAATAAAAGLFTHETGGEPTGDPSGRHYSFESIHSTMQLRILTALVASPRGGSLLNGAARRRSQISLMAHESALLSPHPHGSSPGSGCSPVHGNGRSNTAQYVPRTGGAVGAANAGIVPKSSITPPATPITEEEHLLLVQMYLFPEQYETAARRVPHFAVNNSGLCSPGMAPNGSAFSGGTSGGEAGPFNASQYQKRISRMGGNGVPGRTRSQGRIGGGGSVQGLNSKKGRNGGGDNSGEGSNTLAADFFSPKNQSLYRPPSPMILSMRNSTAYRNRMKRLEEQKEAAKTAGGAGAHTYPGHASSQPGLRGSYAASAVRGEAGAGEFENTSMTAPSKTTSW